MRKREIEHFKEVLKKKRVDVQKQIKYFEEHQFKTNLKDRSGDISAHSTHPADQVLTEIDHENAYVLASKQRELLYAIDEAFARMEENTYGHCIICEKEIGMERLKAVPWAELCVSCQEKIEKEERETKSKNV